MTKQQIDQLISDEISNFIEYYTSNEADRVLMHFSLQDYMSEVYERPTYTKRKYEVATDHGEEGTMTIAAFETEEEAIAFMKRHQIVHPSINVFVDTCTFDFFNNNQ